MWQFAAGDLIEASLTASCDDKQMADSRKPNLGGRGGQHAPGASRRACRRQRISRCGVGAGAGGSRRRQGTCWGCCKGDHGDTQCNARRLVRRWLRPLPQLLAAATLLLHRVCCTRCIGCCCSLASRSRAGSGRRFRRRQRLQLLRRAAGPQAGRQRQQEVTPAGKQAPHTHVASGN